MGHVDRNPMASKRPEAPDVHPGLLATTRRASALAIAVMSSSAGCVQRVMHVTSDPPGAVVTMNDREIGRTPFDHEFLWYGNYDVVARADGYQGLTTTRELTAPWWQWVPFDLLTDFLPVRDDQRIDLKLVPLGTPDPAGVLARGEQDRLRLESSEHTTHRRVLSISPPTVPTTAPTTGPTTDPTTGPATAPAAP